MNAGSSPPNTETTRIVREGHVRPSGTSPKRSRQGGLRLELLLLLFRGCVPSRNVGWCPGCVWDVHDGIGSVGRTSASEGDGDNRGSDSVDPVRLVDRVGCNEVLVVLVVSVLVVTDSGKDERAM